ncbi:hypothetical protein [Kitasatospora sp. MAP5-34]|uniref:hypothetical protein n=1 Tax=Kitasatospora sp. MAP5-34 TaxID=3035102 RepID=UPI00247681FB|nr:hypothetical protein [Kitasatospora sp. MAP5-34]MDH6580485.1 hypothetical protein [Kitasatospora sp. MAP5-34]
MSEKSENPAKSAGPPPGPTSFLAARAALDAIDDAVRTAQQHTTPADAVRPEPASSTAPEQALAALLLLRELRTQLAYWESPLIETARHAGATWAELAHPMGVASRQAAETRYLRLRPTTTPEGTATGAQRVKSVRDHRAGERTVTTWARTHAADLRILAAQITALTDLAPAAQPGLDALRTALGHTDAAHLLAPLTGMRPHLSAYHHDLATRLDTLDQQTRQLRHDSTQRRT